jgi:hypothetical protein
VEHSIFKSPQGLLPLDPFDGLQFWQVVREQFFWIHCSTWNTPFLEAASRAALIDMSPANRSTASGPSTVLLFHVEHPFSCGRKQGRLD